VTRLRYRFGSARQCSCLPLDRDDRNGCLARCRSSHRTELGPFAEPRSESLAGLPEWVWRNRWHCISGGWKPHTSLRDPLFGHHSLVIDSEGITHWMPGSGQLRVGRLVRHHEVGTGRNVAQRRDVRTLTSCSGDLSASSRYGGRNPGISPRGFPRGSKIAIFEGNFDTSIERLLELLELYSEYRVTG
jgi:hypothetical protein